jgi:uncharacterized protein YbjT (DUF2867 family)
MTSSRERRTVAVTGAAGGVGSRVIRALTGIDSSRTVVALTNGSISLVTRDDVAEALAAASCSEMTGELALTGPAALHRQEIEGAMRSAYAHSVSLAVIDEDSYCLQARKCGMTPWVIEASPVCFAP